MRHRWRRRPAIAGGVEQVGGGQAVVVADVAPDHEKPAVGQKGVAGTEDVRRDRSRGERAAGGIPDLGISEPPPREHPAVGQQMQVHGHDGPGKGAPHSPVLAAGSGTVDPGGGQVPPLAACATGWPW